MAEGLHKVLMFMKRRPGMSLAEFRDYYERHHAKLVMKYMGPSVRRYVRRYVAPVANGETGADGELDFDVITELWVEDPAAAAAVLDMAKRGLTPADVVGDELRLFERSSIRFAAVTECDSALPPSAVSAPIPPASKPL